MCHTAANVDRNLLKQSGLDQCEAKSLYLKRYRHGPFASRGAGGLWQNVVEESHEAGGCAKGFASSPLIFQNQVALFPPRPALGFPNDRPHFNSGRLHARHVRARRRRDKG